MENNNEKASTGEMTKEFAKVTSNYINDIIRKQYYKEWRKNNKDRIKKYNERFWKKQAEKLDNKEK